MLWPVTKLAAALARKTTTAAVSSGSWYRPSGIVRLRPVRCASARGALREAGVAGALVRRHAHRAHGIGSDPVLGELEREHLGEPHDAGARRRERADVRRARERRRRREVHDRAAGTSIDHPARTPGRPATSRSGSPRARLGTTRGPRRAADRCRVAGPCHRTGCSTRRRARARAPSSATQSPTASGSVSSGVQHDGAPPFRANGVGGLVQHRTRHAIGLLWSRRVAHDVDASHVGTEAGQLDRDAPGRCPAGGLRRRPRRPCPSKSITRAPPFGSRVPGELVEQRLDLALLDVGSLAAEIEELLHALAGDGIGERQRGTRRPRRRSPRSDPRTPRRRRRFASATARGGIAAIRVASVRTNRSASSAASTLLT